MAFDPKAMGLAPVWDQTDQGDSFSSSPKQIGWTTGMDGGWVTNYDMQGNVISKTEQSEGGRVKEYDANGKVTADYQRRKQTGFFEDLVAAPGQIVTDVVNSPIPKVAAMMGAAYLGAQALGGLAGAGSGAAAAGESLGVGSESFTEIMEIAKETGGANPSMWDTITKAAETFGSNPLEATKEVLGTGYEKLAAAGKSIFDTAAKNPLDTLKIGLGTVGGMYAVDEKRKSADADRRARIEEMDHAAALKQQNEDRQRQLNAESFGPLANMKRVGAQKPLSRIDGTRVFNLNSLRP